MFLLALSGGALVFRMLGRQQKMARDSDGPPDLYRADDSEAGPPFDPVAPSRTAEDFFAAGRNPQWMRGDRDADFSSHAKGVQMFPGRLRLPGLSAMARGGMTTRSAVTSSGGCPTVYRPALCATAPMSLRMIPPARRRECGPSPMGPQLHRERRRGEGHPQNAGTAPDRGMKHAGAPSGSHNGAHG